MKTKINRERERKKERKKKIFLVQNNMVVFCAQINKETYYEN